MRWPLFPAELDKRALLPRVPLFEELNLVLAVAVGCEVDDDGKTKGFLSCRRRLRCCC